MQTFMAYGSDFEATAQILDDKRLGKQRVECLQILNALRDNTGWRHHPATAMWRGYSNALVAYGLAICNEWVTYRGYADTCHAKIAAYTLDENIILPPWIDDKRLTSTHKRMLQRKNPDEYPEVWATFTDLTCHPNKCNYWWPTHVS